MGDTAHPVQHAGSKLGVRTMPARLRHFSINADDLGRARTFYAAVFGWRFEAWGPPGST